jgi:hypothetical protein
MSGDFEGGEVMDEFLQGAATMADGALGLEAEFGESLSRLIVTFFSEKKQRIVAKVARPARRIENPALSGTLELRGHFTFRIGKGQCADKARSTLLGGLAFKEGQKLRVVGCIVAVLAGEAG